MSGSSSSSSELIVLGPEDPLLFTLGLELEFALVAELPEHLIPKTTESDSEDSENSEDWLRINPLREAHLNYEDVLREELNNHLISHNIDAVQDQAVTSKWYVDLDPSIQPDREMDAQRQGTIRVYNFPGGRQIRDPNGDAVFARVEINSRILEYKGVDGFEEVFEEIRRVVDAIHSFEETEALVTKSCGLHLHVGQRDLGFSLNPLKNLLMLSIIGQYQIDEIHPAHRLQSSYCWPMSNVLTSEYRHGSVWRIARLIENIPTGREFNQFVHSHRNQKGTDGAYEGRQTRQAAINFMNLSQDFPWRKQTIEFRQHEGTLDAEAIRRWMLFVLGIMTICNTKKIPVSFRQIFDRVMHFGPTEDYHLSDFLGDLDLTSVARLYEGHTHSHQYGRDMFGMKNMPWDWFAHEPTPTPEQTRGRDPWYIHEQ